jgi:hypothetical protein
MNSYAFYKKHFDELTISSNVDGITEYAFGGSYINVLIFQSATPPYTFDKNAFAEANIYTIKVPTGSLNAYKAKLTNFANASSATWEEYDI